ncbi:MAG TPA: hypothetical protein VKG79_03350, partial [Bryobacteraceae bacterium]|nr:hypothetical protein [Bryobacteraceae bacterium]
DARIQVHTGDRGEYRTPPLRIGEYTISIEAAGFKRFNQRGIVLDIGDVRQVDAVLEVGQVSDSVNVEASAPLLQTSDATVGTVIGNQQITNLPLNGRDYLQLAALSSGTIPSTTVANGNQVGISIGGQAGTAAAFLLDGLDNNTQTIMPSHGNQKEVIKPSIDAIQEFKVVTNLYSAEYGRSSSGVVSVTLKSGTNEIHGVGYEFLRNEALDAKNLFATHKSPFKRNQFGANIKLWMGDSRGHWEGNTLVVDVTNNNSKGRLSRAGDFASDKLRVTERFEFQDADHMQYRAVLDDPSTYTRPWTFGFDMKRSIFGAENPTKDDAHYEQWEEACYEGMQPVDYSLRPERGGDKK